MRRILIDRARQKKSLRRGGEYRRTNLDAVGFECAQPPNDFLDINDAQSQFERLDPIKAQLVKMRYFAGMTIPETAEILGISEKTAHRYWVFARAWLHKEQGDGESTENDQET